jgi:pterin-4a-carbinolamine dehydratase
MAQNTVGASCKRHDKLRDIQAFKVKEAIGDGDISSERDLNQEIGLACPGDTRWNSHYKSLVNLIILFGSVLEVLDDIKENSDDPKKRGSAITLIDSLTTFDFAFSCCFMKNVLGITNELSQALQVKEQDIMNAIALVAVVKNRLQDMRDNGWDLLMNKVKIFCDAHDIEVLKMEDKKVAKRSERAINGMTNEHYYRIDFFNSVIDMIHQELNNRFNEANTELLRCMSCLNPSNNFGAYDKVKLYIKKTMCLHFIS